MPNFDSATRARLDRLLLAFLRKADEIYAEAGGDLPKRYELNEYKGQDCAE